MTTQPRQPHCSGLPSVTVGITHHFATVAVIGNVYLKPLVLNYTDQNESTGLDSLLVCYREHLSKEQRPYFAIIEMLLKHLWDYRKGTDGKVPLHGSYNVNGVMVGVFVADDATKLPDGKPQTPKVEVEGHPWWLGTA